MTKLRETGEMRNSVSLRNLISKVYPDRAIVPLEVALSLQASAPPNWQIVLRSSGGDVTTVTKPVRKYLSVRRTSRRAYNRHMSQMHEHLSDVAMPAILIFSGLVGMAIGLSLFMP